MYLTTQVDFNAKLNADETFVNESYENDRGYFQKFCYRREHDMPGFKNRLRNNLVTYATKSLGVEFANGSKVVAINYASDIPRVVLKNNDGEYKREDAKAYRFGNYTFYNNGYVSVYNEKTKKKETKSSKEIIESWPQ